MNWPSAGLRDPSQLPDVWDTPFGVVLEDPLQAAFGQQTSAAESQLQTEPNNSQANTAYAASAVQDPPQRQQQRPTSAPLQQQQQQRSGHTLSLQDQSALVQQPQLQQQSSVRQQSPTEQQSSLQQQHGQPTTELPADIKPGVLCTQLRMGSALGQYHGIQARKYAC